MFCFGRGPETNLSNQYDYDKRQRGILYNRRLGAGRGSFAVYARLARGLRSRESGPS